MLSTKFSLNVKWILTEPTILLHCISVWDLTQLSFLFVFHRVLCETVKDFVSKVGTASANSDPLEADEPESLTQKVWNRVSTKKKKELTAYVVMPCLVD